MINTILIDFFIVPTVTIRVLFVIIELNNSRRKVIHFNTTEHPIAKWTAQQIIEAFPWDTKPEYLLKDRDSIYGNYFRQRVRSMDIKEVITSPGSPWQNPYVERLIGSVRRECLNHIIVLSEKRLLKILSSYFIYYNQDRTHCGLDKEVPVEHPVQSEPYIGSKIIKLYRIGGLHNRYQWKEAA
jgi:transposase InsO family protein